jgi:hypothetical protein
MGIAKSFILYRSVYRTYESSIDPVLFNFSPKIKYSKVENFTNAKIISKYRYFPYVIGQSTYIQTKPTYSTNLKLRTTPKIFNSFKVSPRLGIPTKTVSTSLKSFFNKSTLYLITNNFTEYTDHYYKTFSMKPRSYNKFTLTYIGLFVTNNLYRYYDQYAKIAYGFLYKIKKHLYSFMKPNQVKNQVLKRKATITLYRLVLNNSVSSVQAIPFFTNTLFSKTKLISLLQNFSSQNNNQTQYHQRTLINLTHTIPLTPHPTTNNISEVRIPRVKFKPGYKRLWRDSRVALKELIGLKFLYQHQLSKYITRFFKKTSAKSYLHYELVLDKLVLYSRIVPDYHTFKMFYNANLFFVNGKIPLKVNINCVVNDFIQLVVSKWYYVFFRWLINWSLDRSFKVKKLIYRKGLSSKYQSMKSKKQRSYVVPDWVFTSMYDFSDIKPFLEVDYFSLSFFLVYEPYTTYYYPPTNLTKPLKRIYRLYNWKYIT